MPKMPTESFRLTANGECQECGEQVSGWIAFDKNARVVDSGGFVVFGDGITCDKCLGEDNDPKSMTPLM